MCFSMSNGTFPFLPEHVWKWLKSSGLILYNSFRNIPQSFWIFKEQKAFVSCPLLSTFSTSTNVQIFATNPHLTVLASSFHDGSEIVISEQALILLFPLPACFTVKTVQCCWKQILNWFRALLTILLFHGHEQRECVLWIQFVPMLLLKRTVSSLLSSFQNAGNWSKLLFVVLLAVKSVWGKLIVRIAIVSKIVNQKKTFMVRKLKPANP